MRFASLMLTMVVAVPSALHSQDAMVRAWPVAAGSRIRIRTPAFGEQEGTLVSVKGDSLMFRAADEIAYLPIAMSQVTRLDVSTGTHSRTGTMAAFGFLIGAGAGAILGAWSYPEPTCDTRVQYCVKIGPG